jgi:hypothetical protein
MKHKIPNTNLTLSEAEIQAVVDFAHQRSMGCASQNEFDYKDREEYKKYFNKKRLQDKNGQIPSPAPEFSYYRKEAL